MGKGSKMREEAEVFQERHQHIASGGKAGDEVPGGSGKEEVSVHYGKKIEHHADPLHAPQAVYQVPDEQNLNDEERGMNVLDGTQCALAVHEVFEGHGEEEPEKRNREEGVKGRDLRGEEYRDGEDTEGSQGNPPYKDRTVDNRQVLPQPFFFHHVIFTDKFPKEQPTEGAKRLHSTGAGVEGA